MLRSTNESATRTYGQYCGLARALDHVGDRWTLLIVRELLLAPASFGLLKERLAGIGPSLLSERLERLTGDGLVERNDAPARSKAVTYSLTSAGRELEPVVLALIRCATRWMADGPGGDVVEAAWTPLALRALLDGLPVRGRRRGVVRIEVDGVVVTIDATGDARRVGPDVCGGANPHGGVAAAVVGPVPAVLAVASGGALLAGSALVVSGDARLAAAALEP